jgi:deazaflavin-dependent oxidoreductase (nitroreductase family)
MNSWDERNKAVIEEFRTHGGQVKGWAPLILLTTTGAKTGRPRIAPLMLVTDGDRILAVASKGGYPKHPEWYLNLLAHPKVTVEVGSEKFDTTARILTGNEREQAFTRAVEVFPPMPPIKRGRPAKFLSLHSNGRPNNSPDVPCIGLSFDTRF